MLATTSGRQGGPNTSTAHCNTSLVGLGIARLGQAMPVPFRRLPGGLVSGCSWVILPGADSHGWLTPTNSVSADSSSKTSM
jgi:hypothetical protein